MTESATGKRKQSGLAEPPAKRRRVEGKDVNMTDASFSLISLEEICLNNILSFLPFEEKILNTSLVCKELNRLIFGTVRNLNLCEDETNFTGPTELVKVVSKKFPNLTSLTLDGFESLNDVALASLVKHLPASVTELHIRECNLKNTRIVSNSLVTLKFSLCSPLNSLRVHSESLLHLEFYNCDFVNTPKLDTPNLESLHFFSCTSLSDKILGLILRQFQPPEEDEGSLGYGDSQDCQPIGQPLNIDSQSNSQFTTSLAARPYNTSLKRICLSECEPITYPYIECSSLEDVRLINCQKVQQPIIKGERVTNLQLNWCENIHNLVLGCENLRTIDLTGVGVNLAQGSNRVYSSVRERITNAIQTYYDGNIHITY